MGGARRGGEAVARRDEFEWLARSGLIARGVVYGLIGVLAVKLAVGAEGRVTNQQGALRTIVRQPFGEVLLIAVAVGLAGYAAWRLMRAALGHGGQESDSAVDRVAALVSGLVYAALCVTAVKILSGASGGGGSGTPKKATAGVLGWSGGTVLVAIAGVGLIGVGLYQGYKGLARKFVDEANEGEMSEAVERAYTALGVVGHLARAVVFTLVGYGLITAAVDFDPKKAIGLEGALGELANDSYGAWLLGVVAAGLISFGLYSIADARFRKI